MTEPDIRKWFSDLRSNLDEIGALDVLDDPSRVFNSDDSNIQLAPKTGTVVGIKGWKNCYEIAAGPEKSTLGENIFRRKHLGENIFRRKH